MDGTKFGTFFIFYILQQQTLLRGFWPQIIFEVLALQFVWDFLPGTLGWERTTLDEGMPKWKLSFLN